MATQDIVQLDILRRQRLGLLTIAEPMYGEQKDPWTTPYLVADGRHAFYVTTVTSQIPGASPITGLVVDLKPESAVELTVLDPAGPITAESVEKVVAQPYTGSTNRARMQAFLSEDAYIQGALASIGTVKFDDVAIGVTGAVRNGSAKAG